MYLVIFTQTRAVRELCAAGVSSVLATRITLTRVSWERLRDFIARGCFGFHFCSVVTACLLPISIARCGPWVLIVGFSPAQSMDRCPRLSVLRCPVQVQALRCASPAHLLMWILPLLTRNIWRGRPLLYGQFGRGSKTNLILILN
jgi:hypothetical protein